MAEVVLHRHELEKGGLPAVCVRCGAGRATPVMTKLHVIAAENPLYMTLRVQDAWLPLCPKHQWHFYRNRIHVIAGALCMAMFLPCLGLTALVLGPFVSDLKFGWVFGIVALVAPVVVGFIVMYIGKYGNVQAGDVTEEGWLVTNVSDRFIKAVQVARKAAER
jgi:hypothetical protein